MQTVINISISGPDARETKEEIKKEAQRRSMSISQFMLWCWDKVKKAHAG